MFSLIEVERLLLDFDYELTGQEYLLFDNAKSVEDSNPSSITWISEKKTAPERLIAQTNASTIVCPKNVKSDVYNKCLIKVDNPKLVFSILINELIIEKPSGHIHESAKIHPEALIHPTAYIGPYTVIGKCSIGKNTIIWGHAFLYDNVEIGENVEIHANTTLGGIGSGYSSKENGELVPFPHLGKTIIEDNVEVGPNTYINRGALSNTIIKKGAKIGNSVCVGHNVEIGENTVVLANSFIAGSVKVGKNSWIGAQVAIKDGTCQGENLTIGLGAVVVKNTESNKTILGNPAEELEIFKRWLKFKKIKSAENI
jgi:UDP-3-O-[3-hydroxymyristoyl] glucosamine N-acyltransferase